MTTWPRMTMASGPVDVSQETLRAMQQPVLYHYDPAFIELFARASQNLQKVFRTNYDVIIMQAEAILGLEAAAASLIEPGDKVLNLVSGVFGKGYEDFVRKYGGEVIEVAVPYNESVRPEQVAEALAANPDVKYLSVVHAETPSGTINPMQEIGRIAREHGVLTIVDTVSGLGSELFSPEDWGMDVAVAGPQKCLSGVPGLSLLSVSPAAWEAMERRATPLRGSFLSMLDWKTSWLENQRFPYTPSVSDMYALDSMLEQTLREGVERLVERHQISARATRAAVRALGLELWAASEDIAAANCTAVLPPDGIPEASIREAMRRDYGVMISEGVADLNDKFFRLGHMGEGAHPTAVVAQIGVLERVLNDLGHSHQLGAGVGAALEEFAGWSDATH